MQVVPNFFFNTYFGKRVFQTLGMDGEIAFSHFNLSTEIDIGQDVILKTYILEITFLNKESLCMLFPVTQVMIKLEFK